MRYDEEVSRHCVHVVPYSALLVRRSSRISCFCLYPFFLIEVLLTTYVRIRAHIQDAKIHYFFHTPLILLIKKHYIILFLGINHPICLQIQHSLRFLPHTALNPYISLYYCQLHECGVSLNTTQHHTTPHSFIAVWISANLPSQYYLLKKQRVRCCVVLVRCLANTAHHHTHYATAS